MKTLTVINFDELLDHAQTMGYHHNKAHDLLQAADIIVGSFNTDYYKDCFHPKGTHEEAKAILKSFMNKYNLAEFYITHKYYEI